MVRRAKGPYDYFNPLWMFVPDTCRPAHKEIGLAWSSSIGYDHDLVYADKVDQSNFHYGQGVWSG